MDTNSAYLALREELRQLNSQGFKKATSTFDKIYKEDLKRKMLHQVSYQGMVYKQGKKSALRGQQWNKRWVVLKDDLLYYFKNQNDAKPAGVIMLEGCTVDTTEDVAKKPNCFIIKHAGGSRDYVFSCEKASETTEWVYSIKRSMETEFRFADFKPPPGEFAMCLQDLKTNQLFKKQKEATQANSPRPAVWNAMAGAGQTQSLPNLNTVAGDGGSDGGTSTPTSPSTKKTSLPSKSTPPGVAGGVPQLRDMAGIASSAANIVLNSKTAGTQSTPSTPVGSAAGANRLIAAAAASTTPPPGSESGASGSGTDYKSDSGVSDAPSTASTGAGLAAGKSAAATRPVSTPAGQTSEAATEKGDAVAEDKRVTMNLSLKKLTSEGSNVSSTAPDTPMWSPLKPEGNSEGMLSPEAPTGPNIIRCSQYQELDEEFVEVPLTYQEQREIALASARILQMSPSERTQEEAEYVEELKAYHETLTNIAANEGGLKPVYTLATGCYAFGTAKAGSSSLSMTTYDRDKLPAEKHTQLSLADQMKIQEAAEKIFAKAESERTPEEQAYVVQITEYRKELDSVIQGEPNLQPLYDFSNMTLIMSE
eukprot:GFYU01008263.1.p1 GENE.GFYU01008263.1~~GFYU01008263.1.p1  ORF type:complete len:592 (-),score=116.42 GFYU01008263.1:16-1791(-)